MDDSAKSRHAPTIVDAWFGIGGSSDRRCRVTSRCSVDLGRMRVLPPGAMPSSWLMLGSRPSGESWSQLTVLSGVLPSPAELSGEGSSDSWLYCVDRSRYATATARRGVSIGAG